MNKTIIFDMDGVLIDSEYAMREAGVRALAHYGVKAAHEDFMAFTGMGEDSFIGGVARLHGLTYNTAMKDLAYKIYGDELRGDIIVFDGIKELITELKARGYTLAVASAADLVKVLINLDCIGVSRDDFNALTTGSDVTNKKPHPEIFLTTAKKLNVDPGDCIVLEDAKAGVQAAKAAGMHAVGICSTFTPDELMAAGADETLRFTKDFLEILR